MKQGLVVFLFIVLVFINVMLAFQVYDDRSKTRDARLNQQEQVQRSAQLYVQSVTQSHPMFAYDHSKDAKTLLDDIISRYNGVTAAEKALKLPSGRIDSLRKKNDERLENMRDYIMEKVIELNPQLDMEENETARIRLPKTDKKKRRRRARS